jgi:hypothetical protein
MHTPHTDDERIQDTEYIISSLPTCRQVYCGETDQSEASLRAQRGNNRQPGGPALRLSADINLAGFLHGHKLEFVRIAVVFRTLLKHHAPSHVCTRTWTASKKWYRAPNWQATKKSL